jgi:predicted dehydrogenase
MKRIGLMGCGSVANYGHIPALLRSNSLDLVAVYDPDPSRLEVVTEKHDITSVFDDVNEFMNSGIDAVTITSPAPVHIDNIRAAAKAGKPVLCEKPLAMTEDESREIIRIAADAGITVYTGFDYRFSPVSLTIRELVARKAIGEVRSLRLIYNWHCHGKYEQAANGALIENARRRDRMEEGGPIVDCGVHQVDLARFWLGGDVTSWSVAGAWIDEYDAPDHVYLHMNHDSGVHTLVEMSYSYCHTCAEPVNHFTYELIGTDGVIRYNREQRLFEVRTRQGTECLPFAHEKNFAGMYEAWSRALSTGECGFLATAYDGMEAARITREAVDELIEQRAR